VRLTVITDPRTTAFFFSFLPLISPFKNKKKVHDIFFLFLIKEGYLHNVSVSTLLSAHVGTRGGGKDSFGEVEEKVGKKRRVELHFHYKHTHTHICLVLVYHNKGVVSSLNSSSEEAM